MGDRERFRGVPSVPDQGEEGDPFERAFRQIVENWLIDRKFPEQVKATDLVNVMRASGLFPKRARRQEIVNELRGVLPQFGYSDTVFRRRLFLKMESKRFH